MALITQINLPVPVAIISMSILLALDTTAQFVLVPQYVVPSITARLPVAEHGVVPTRKSVHFNSILFPISVVYCSLQFSSGFIEIVFPNESSLIGAPGQTKA